MHHDGTVTRPAESHMDLTLTTLIEKQVLRAPSSGLVASYHLDSTLRLPLSLHLDPAPVRLNLLYLLFTNRNLV